jgi:hypothetical protein
VFSLRIEHWRAYCNLTIASEGNTLGDDNHMIHLILLPIYIFVRVFHFVYYSKVSALIIRLKSKIGCWRVNTAGKLITN